MSRSDLLSELEYCATIIESLGFPTCVNHGDLYRNNMIYEEKTGNYLHLFPIDKKNVFPH